MGTTTEISHSFPSAMLCLVLCTLNQRNHLQCFLSQLFSPLPTIAVMFALQHCYTNLVLNTTLLILKLHTAPLCKCSSFLLNLYISPPPPSLKSEVFYSHKAKMGSKAQQSKVLLSSPGRHALEESLCYNLNIGSSKAPLDPISHT